MSSKNKTKRLHFDTLPSTQDYAKERRVDGENLAVTATYQTGGKGTKGRTFSSQEGGVYLSKLTFYEDLHVKSAFKIMIGAAVAVCETLRFYGLKPLIKWPNDICVKDKKICGILIENVFAGDKVRSSVVGIGLNVFNSLPEELADIATSMKLARKESDATIADLMTDGCNMGVKSLAKYLNKYKAADEASKDITKRLIHLEEQLAVDLRPYL